MPPSKIVLDMQRESSANRLQEIVGEMETALAREDFDPEHEDYVALREARDKEQNHLADLLTTIGARALAEQPVPRPDDGSPPVSLMRQVLREYDRGMSRRFDIEYEIQRAYHVIKTDEPQFAQNPTRIAVAELPVITPVLDVIQTVPSLQKYDFTVPPPPVPAGTVAEGGQKPAVEYTSTRVSGDLETDAHIVDISRQTLEDDATAERQLRSWLESGVKLRQNSKAAAAIGAATGTGTATGTDLLTAVRKGKAELVKLGVYPNAVFLNPDDAAGIDLKVLDSSKGSPVTQEYLWGMRVVETPGVIAGTAWVGDMRQAVYMLFRNNISTYLTDAGQSVETTPRDRFQHNLIGVLGEGRSKVHVVQPKLLVKCTVGAARTAAAEK